MEKKIYLVPMGKVETWILEAIDKRLEKTFNSEVEIKEGMELPEETYNTKRKQYYSSPILRKLRSFLKLKEREKALGITDVDLYTRRLNFVFGEAELDGRFAIISLARLRQSFYGLSEDKTLFTERAVKEAVHELGHVYGLRHCPNADCVMYFSNSLSDTDRKSASFCAQCEKILEKLRR